MSRARRSAGAVLLAALTTCSGCFVMRCDAPPPPPHVRLLSEDAPVEFSRKYQKWYAAWGLFPLTPADDPKYIIEHERLVEARILQQDSTEDLFAGFIFTYMFVGVILPQSVIVEGNRAPHPPAAHATDS
ncbi:MAG: hypothetical protein SF182_19470 [Deltaproteobacteria bacterium]|nr:hypothetical protein [Deltaproteobacteria bacterium]